MSMQTVRRPALTSLSVTGIAAADGLTAACDGLGPDELPADEGLGLPAV